QMNYLAVKSGVGYDTGVEPAVGDLGILVNRNVVVKSVANAPKLVLKPQVGFEMNKGVGVDITINENSAKPFHVGRLFYQNYFNNGSLPTLLKNRNIACS